MIEITNIEDFDKEIEFMDTPFEERTTIRVLSAASTDVKPYLEVPNPLLDFDNYVPAIKNCLNMVAAAEEPSFVTPLQINASPIHASFHSMAKGMRGVLSHDYVPVAVREKQAEIAKAFACPLISFLNAETRRFRDKYTVLLIGSGEGKDISRLLQANPSISKLVAIDPDKTALSKLATRYPNAITLIGTIARRINDAITEGPYDIIVANMSAHYVFGVPSGKMVAELCPLLLSQRGTFFGSYVDVPSVKASSVAQFMKCGHSVQYLGEKHGVAIDGEVPVNGIASLSMAGVVFDDPYLTTEQMLELFEGVPVSFNIYDGRTVVCGPNDGSPLYQPPLGFAHVLKRPELTMYRCFILNKCTDAVGAKYYPTPYLRHSDVSGLTQRATCVAFNKGKPLQPYESQYIDAAACWIAEKRDGVPVKVVFSHKAMEFVTADMRVFKPVGFKSHLTLDFMLQAELIVLPDKPNCYSVVVVDVLVAPWGVSGSFLCRWRWLQAIYGTGEGWPFQLQEWVNVGTPRAIELLHNAREGVVLQSLTAPPSSLKGGLGSARYVKRIWTVDVRDADGVVSEFTMEGKFVRFRPDKATGNPSQVVDTIRTAVQYNQFVLYLFSKYVGTYSASWKRLTQYIVDRVPPREWSIADRVLFYCNRHNPKFTCLAPDLFQSLNIAFAALLGTYVDGTVKEETVFVDDEVVYEDDPANDCVEILTPVAADIAGVFVAPEIVTILSDATLTNDEWNYGLVPSDSMIQCFQLMTT